MKAHACDIVLSNSFFGLKVGASVGGADLNAPEVICFHFEDHASVERWASVDD